MLDAPDDTDDTDADFSSTALSPQPNSAIPTETACTGGGSTGTTPVSTVPTGQRAAALKMCAKSKSKKKKKKCKKRARLLPV